MPDRPKELFRLGRDYRDGRVEFDASPVGPDGMRLKHWDPAATQASLRYRDRRPLPDAWLIGTTLLVSEPVLETIRRHRVQPAIRWIPVQLENGGKDTGRCFAAMTTESLRVLDLTRAECRYYEGSERVADVKRWVIDGSDLPEFDLFQAELSAWFVTPQLKDSLLRGGCVGLEFLRCDVTQGDDEDRPSLRT